MKEFDFDELDRAVNTLMGTVPKMAEPAKQDDIKTLTITPTLAADEVPKMPEISAAPAETTAPREMMSVGAPAPREAVRSVAPAARRSGRFMDVIHPSAAATRKPSPSLGVSRQGVTLEPLVAPVVMPELVVEEPSGDIAPAPKDDLDLLSDTDTAQTWPDPIEFSETTHDDVSQQADAEEQLAQEADATEPLISPFIADAKVEKRPLGSPAPELIPEPIEDIEQPEADIPQDAALSPDDEVPLPEELQGDLMAIEADSAVADEITPERPSGGEVLSAKEVSPVQAAVVETPASLVTEPVPVAPAAAPLAAAASVGAVSIPQQYREEPSTGDQTTGSIYDTDTYHQPLEHPAKKKTGWLWVIWVLILLLLGAGGGALAYLYLLQ